MWRTAFFLSFLSLATCIPSIVHEKREWPLQDALDRQRVESDTMLPIRIGLRQSNEALANAEDWLMEVSDPDSAIYGRHWTQKEVIEAFQPSVETVQAVAKWLSSNGIRFTHSDNKQWLAFDLAASKAEALFQTTYFEHRTKKEAFEVSCDEYSVPEILQDHIDFITPGIKSKKITFRSKRSREHHGIKDTRNEPEDPAHKPLTTPSPPYPTPSKTIENKRSLNFTVSSGISYQIPKHTTPPYPPDDLEHCHRSVSPACIRALYKFDIPDPQSSVSSKNTLGIFESWELAYQSDLNKFWRYYTQIPPGTMPIYNSIDGAIIIPAQVKNWTKMYTKGEFGEVLASEAPFDYQLSFPIIYPQNVTTFQTDDPYWAAFDGIREYGDIFNDFLDAIDGSFCTYTAYNVTPNSPALDPQYPDPRKHGWDHPLQCGVFKPTPVISMSYGTDELTLPGPYLKRQCSEWLKLGLQGVSLFASSGDLGVGRCTRGPAGDRLFGPLDPVGCPWVTGAGASRIRRDWVPGDPAPEVAAGFSGGGFSVYHERPAYQNAAVTEYLTKYPPGIPYFYNGHYGGNSTGRYNRNGRGIPDVSAVGFNIATISSGEYGKSFGTSAAAPIVASFFNRINEERLRIGKGPVGFVNPTLYKNPHVMNDIVVGYNAYDCTQGFHCQPGWDPVSGLGTPNYPKLLKLFLSLP